MASKSSRAFRTISEASRELDLKPHVLRFWEAKFSDLRPLTRAGGRRFYRPEDIDFLRGLRILLHDEKHKIKDVQKLIKLRGPHSVIELGQSAAKAPPSRPIAERDLVPEHIQGEIPAATDKDQSLIRPVYDRAANDADATAPTPTSNDGYFNPVDHVDEKHKIRVQPSLANPAIVEAASETMSDQPDEDKPLHRLSDKQRKELHLALGRLEALRRRWEKFV